MPTREDRRARDDWVIDAVRPRCERFGGGLARTLPDDLAAYGDRSLLERSPELDAAHLDDVLLGAAHAAGEDNRDVARMAAPVHVDRAWAPQS